MIVDAVPPCLELRDVEMFEVEGLKQEIEGNTGILLRDGHPICDAIEGRALARFARPGFATLGEQRWHSLGQTWRINLVKQLGTRPRHRVVLMCGAKDGVENEHDTVLGDTETGGKRRATSGSEKNLRPASARRARHWDKEDGGEGDGKERKTMVINLSNVSYLIPMIPSLRTDHQSSTILPAHRPPVIDHPSCERVRPRSASSSWILFSAYTVTSKDNPDLTLGHQISPKYLQLFRDAGIQGTNWTPDITLRNMWCIVAELAQATRSMHSFCDRYPGTEAYFQVGAPAGRPTLLSRFIQTDYTAQICRCSFPDGSFTKVPASPILERWNKFGALKLQVDRLAQVDGGIDLWQYVCVHSPDGFNRFNTLLRPYYEIKVASPFPNLCLSADTNLSHRSARRPSLPLNCFRDTNGLLNISAEPGFIQAIHKYEIQGDKVQWSVKSRRVVYTGKSRFSDPHSPLTRPLDLVSWVKAGSLKLDVCVESTRRASPAPWGSPLSLLETMQIWVGELAAPPAHRLQAIRGNRTHRS
ncbi:hypothetical protein B0H16DRAFT_1761346 [Mycena metata]|uniref:Uncharacterized protein n=1 Tax=Mycena metata TaxID=1033252 RepID=A0AAD7IBR0_9AGAR|nr:hypothetical protein B0H16DRAFT_1761346 [Mycena metata]